MTIFTIQNLYNLSKCFGFVSFKLSSTNTLCAHDSRSNFIYSIFYTIFFSSLLFYAEIEKYVLAVMREAKYPTATVVKALEFSVNVTRTIVILIIHLINRKKYVLFINETNQLYNTIRYVTKQTRTKSFLDKKGFYLLNFKKFSVFAQITLLTIAFSCYSHFYRGNTRTEFILQIYKTIYSNVMAIIFTNIYFCGMLVMLQFYRNLNKQLKNCMKSLKIISQSKMNRIKMQMYCDISDDIDMISIMYSRVTDVTSRLNTFFSIPVLLTILNDSMITLFAVIYNYCI